MQAQVFYSWQSDTPAAFGRHFVRDALATAIARLAEDASLVIRPELDQDTQGVPGAPAIVSTILRKIDQCAVFVADVTLTNQRREVASPRLSPNPNVLFEAGYALKGLSHDRVLLVFDVASGSPEELPFDLRGNRVIKYDSRRAKGDAAAEMISLEGDLRKSIHLILTSTALPASLQPPVSIDLNYEVRERTSARHAYRLPVWVTNTGKDELRDWSVEVEFPRELLEPRNSYPNMRPVENGLVAMKQTEAGHSGPFSPGERKQTMGIDYFIDETLFDQQARLFPLVVRASVFSGGKLIQQASRTVEELQEF